MKHNVLEELLSRYVDGELSAEEREVVQKHLQQCESCRRLLAGLEEVDSRIATLKPVSPEAAGAAPDIRRGLSIGMQRWRPKLSLDKAVGYFGMSVAIALVGALLLMFNAMLKAATGNLVGPDGTPIPRVSIPFSIDTLKIIAEREMSDSYDPSHTLPLWTPDGSRIAFTKRPEWVKQAGINGWSPWGEIWTAKGDGSNPTLLVSNGLAPGWSRDSQWLYYSASEPQNPTGELTSTGLYQIRPDGTNKELLYQGEPNRGIYMAPCTLPNGQLSFPTARSGIGLLDPKTRQLQPSIPGVPAVSRYWCSPDGNQLAYTADYKLWLGPSKGNAFRELGAVSVDESLPVSWSADGRSLVYATVRELWVAKGDGSGQRKVIDLTAFPETKDSTGAALSRPLLSPDGRVIFVSLFSRGKEERLATYMVDVASGRTRLFAEGKSLVALSPDGLTGLLSYSEMTLDGSVRRPLIAVTLSVADTASPVTTQTAALLPTPVQRVQPTSTPTIAATVAAKPLLTPNAGGSGLEIAVVDADKDVSLVNHDGSAKKKLIDAGQCPKPGWLIWSPAGDKLACLNQEHVETKMEGARAWSLYRYTIVVADAEGRLLGKIGPLESFAFSFAWSPTGQHLAYGVVSATTPKPLETYYIAEPSGKVVAQLQGGESWLTNDLLQGLGGNLIWSPDGSALAYNAASGGVSIYDLNSKSTRDLGGNLNKPLAWVLGGRELLAAANYDVGAMLPRYEAILLNLTTGERRRAPSLDNSNRFWLSPDGNRAAFLYRSSEGVYAGLAILDFASLAVTPVPDSIIRYGSSTIPYNHAGFSRDGAYLAWADMADGEVAIYRARPNGTDLAKMVTLPYGSVQFSPDLAKIAYGEAVRAGNPIILKAADLDGSSTVELGVGYPFAWQPRK